MQILAADKIEIGADGQATITKDTGEVVQMPVAELYKQRPDLIAKARLDELDINAAFSQELFSTKPGDIEVGDRVVVQGKCIGTVLRTIDSRDGSRTTFRVDLGNGRVNPYWGIELRRI